MSPEGLLVYGVVNVVAALASGASGGGGGFIATPLAIFLGLTPQQAIATGKLNGLMLSAGALTSFRGKSLIKKQHAIVLAIIAIFMGLIAPQIITKIDNDSYENIIGVLLIITAPTLFIKRFSTPPARVKKHREFLAFLLVALVLLAQAVFSTGMGAFVNVVLIAGLGLSPIRANATKRASQIVLNSVLVAGLVGTGLIVWSVAAVGASTAFVGGKLGARVALKRGDQFILVLFAILMLASGLALLIW